MADAPYMDGVVAMLLAGGEGQRLYPLTANRAKPAVPFGGMYRIVDFTLSNCFNSGCRRIFVLVQYKSFSLSRHIRRAWDVAHTDLGEFIEAVPPQKRVSDTWYLGTADAIYQNLYSIESEDPEYVLVLSGDHIYKMDYSKMVKFHRDAGADLTVGTIVVPIEQASRFGILQVDTDLRVMGFEEKPEHPEGLAIQPGVALASMGIYCFTTSVLKRVCNEDAARVTTHDFGRDIIPRMVKNDRVYAYSFQDENKKAAQYWRDVGTLDSYYEANMDLIQIDPLFNLYDRDWPIRSIQFNSPPAKFVFDDANGRRGCAMSSVVSVGCIISGGTVLRSVLSPDVLVDSWAHVTDSILLSGVRVGVGARVRRAIVEKGIQIPSGTVIGENIEDDARRFHVSESGIVLVYKAFPT